MNFLVAMLLLHVKKEEDVFWCLGALVEELLKGYFDKDMVQSRVDLYVFKGLLEKELPALASHFDSFSFDISCVTARWFICIYVDCLPESAVKEVWGRLFQYGRNILHQVALALLASHAEEILSQTDLGMLIMTLQGAAENVKDTGVLMDVAERQGEGKMAENCARLNEKYTPVVLLEINKDNRRHFLRKNPDATAGELDAKFGPLIEPVKEDELSTGVEVAEEATSSNGEEHQRPPPAIAIAATAPSSSEEAAYNTM